MNRWETFSERELKMIVSGLPKVHLMEDGPDARPDRDAFNLMYREIHDEIDRRKQAAREGLEPSSRG